ncbi:C40 family peptidase [Frankia sp. AgB1.9]|uniref:C40 family peptidase n=1 Tax=unclassified Frankia TaxID=2632575 RepID=UPI0019343680|nr:MULTISPECIES: C40 family peptidase [unclassified Frankia]MBL7487795.1 C40 family peptidase [Frankia sp. AgW1.1]MBL7553200.1 C40 family peptidase [Frankia sp. AgB1.9]MBL7622955.1 C40 family peptidase [Frankia sp. AgB1.8]
MAKTLTALGAATVLLIVVIAGAAATVTGRLLCPPALATLLGCTGSTPSQTALADIPTDYLTLYQQAAATCPGLDWTTLAAIGKLESDHGRSTLPGVTTGTNSAGAGGPMQFLATTFTSTITRHPLPPGGASPPSLYNPHDAIYAAADLLCDDHAATDLTASIYAYNHADWYVSDVLTQATQYQATESPNSDGTPSNAALAAVNYAQGQLGIPYLWGGNGPDGGFDCSGLTLAAYQAADINLPRTAQTQHDAGPAVPPDQPLQTGDLVYYGTPTTIHHVAIYIGNGQMITAPGRGQVVKIAPYRWKGDDYAGATRPGYQPDRAG